MYKYTFLPFRHRVRVFRAPAVCPYARLGDGDVENRHSQTTRNRHFSARDGHYNRNDHREHQNDHRSDLQKHLHKWQK